MTKKEILLKIKEWEENPITLPRQGALQEYTELHNKLYDRMSEILCVSNQVVLQPTQLELSPQEAEKIARTCYREMHKTYKKIEKLEKLFSTEPRLVQKGLAMMGALQAR